MKTTPVAHADPERSREQLLLNIKEVHANMRQQYAAFEFLGELKGLEVWPSFN